MKWWVHLAALKDQTRIIVIKCMTLDTACVNLAIVVNISANFNAQSLNWSVQQHTVVLIVKHRKKCLKKHTFNSLQKRQSNSSWTKLQLTNKSFHKNKSTFKSQSSTQITQSSLDPQLILRPIKKSILDTMAKIHM